MEYILLNNYFVVPLKYMAYGPLCAWYCLPSITITRSLRPLSSLPTRPLLVGIVWSTSFLLPLNQNLGSQKTWRNKPRCIQRETEIQGGHDCWDTVETLPTSPFPSSLSHQSQTLIMNSSILFSFTFKVESQGSHLVVYQMVFQCCLFTTAPDIVPWLPQ